MSNHTPLPSDSADDFDLFAKDIDDNLQEQLAKGSYKWTNKYTAILAGLVVITASVSAGIWYGNNHAAASTTNALSNFASRIRGASTGGAFTGAAGSTSGAGASAFAGAGAASGFGGAAGGGFGGSRVSGTVAKVNGNTITITLDAPPSTPIAAGDTVSVRDSGAAATAGGAAASAGAPAGGATSGTTRKRGTGASSSATTGGTAPGGAAGSSTTKPSVGGTPGGNGGGGRFNNPAFTDCLAKNGVTLTPGARPDSTDPKVAAALQACFSTLGGGAPGAGGGFGGGTRPAPTSNP